MLKSVHVLCVCVCARALPFKLQKDHTVKSSGKVSIIFIKSQCFFAFFFFYFPSADETFSKAEPHPLRGERSHPQRERAGVQRSQRKESRPDEEAPPGRGPRATRIQPVPEARDRRELAFPPDSEEGPLGHVLPPLSPPPK